VSNRSEDADDVQGTFEDEMFAHRERYGAQDRRGRPHAVSELLRRAIENTVGSVQTTSSLSREALNYLLQQGDRGKRELVRIVANEVGQFLRGVDLSGELVKVLTSVQLEVNASIRFKPSQDGAVRTVADAQVQLGKETPTKRPQSDAPWEDREAKKPISSPVAAPLLEETEPPRPSEASEPPQANDDAE
jgi:hypothetical protein